LRGHNKSAPIGGRLGFAVVAGVCVWGAMVGGALAIGCTAPQRAACANMATPGSCFQWSCVPKAPPNPVTGAMGYSCVQTTAPVGTACHSGQACIHSGVCGPTGGCNANPGQQQICTDTSLGITEQMHCYCVNYGCQARMANGQLFTGTVSKMCKVGTGP
jgi:hypothetical protein